MEYKDYYATLGISPGASDNEIRDAYRKLARKLHPDLNPGDQKAEERFKEINEAYQALSDPDKRRSYDMLRERQQYRRGVGSGGLNWGEWHTAPGGRVYTRTASAADVQGLGGAGESFSDFFGSIFGASPFDASGSTRATRTRTRPRRGHDEDVPVQITLEEAFHGTTRSIQVGDRRIEANIPPGVRTGSRVRLAGQGAPGTGSGQPGDLFLVVEVQPHPQLERDGDNLTLDLPLDVYTAVAGGEVRVPMLDRAVMLKIPPRTQAGKTFRLRGKGMPRLGAPGQRGDLFARVRLVLPEHMDDDEVAALRRFAERRRTR